MSKTLRINKKDNVVVALQDLSKGDIIDGVELLSDIPKAHKIAIKAIKKDKNVYKYGMPIGHASVNIEAGDHVHSHNVKTNLDDIVSYEYNPSLEITKTSFKDVKVNVYKRSNGDIGIRNELFIIPTVGCTNRIATMMAEAIKSEIDMSKIDDIQVVTHPYGCSQMGDDHENTKKTLQNIAKHPNAGGVLILGLGCENNQVHEFLEGLEVDETRMKSLVIQHVDDELEEGLKLLHDLYDEMAQDTRTEVALSEVKFGLECGGSDGFSGITANVLLGAFSDTIVSIGGTTVLTEVPEMFGAETLLMNRSKDEEVYGNLVDMINDYKNYFKSNNQVIYENPSPGNKEGGITTLEEKSLGCCEKAGKSTVVDVLKHNAPVVKKGLNLLSAPGNDIVATTALGASGCHMVLFTTGRGTPFGGFTPTVKISTNTALYKKKKHWIDFDAGLIASGLSVDQVLEEFMNYIIDVINGKPTRNEVSRFKEIAIFKSGVTL